MKHLHNPKSRHDYFIKHAVIASGIFCALPLIYLVLSSGDAFDFYSITTAYTLLISVIMFVYPICAYLGLKEKLPLALFTSAFVFEVYILSVGSKPGEILPHLTIMFLMYTFMFAPLISTPFNIKPHRAKIALLFFFPCIYLTAFDIQNTWILYAVITPVVAANVAFRTVLDNMLEQSISYQNTIENIAITDELTGCFNRRFFNSECSRLLGHAYDVNVPCSLIILDIDHFKQINDNFGHPAGDSVIRKVVEIIQQTSRDSDIVARIGGEEFVVFLFNTALRSAHAAAERMRRNIQESSPQFLDREGFVCTVSAGVASFHVTGDKLEDMLERADQLLYQSKNGGRNKVSAEPEFEPVHLNNPLLND